MTAPEQQRQQHQEAAAGPQQEQLWDYFVVVGLPKFALQTIQGDAGFLGTDQKYKAAFVDSLPHTTFEESCRLPPQLPTCCLPAGIDIVLFQDLDKADLTPHTFSCVLTGGDGTQLYASCLTFYDRVPSDLAAKHEDLLGAVALKALCLLSKRPYLASSQQVLRELYCCAFQRGSSIPVPDLINSLLAVPCPQQGSPKLCLRLCGSRHVLCAPLPIGPPPGEVSLQPLLEVMQPDSLVGLFAAVLLEQRVLLRSRHHWLLTVAAEGVVRLLYPLRWQHVYIPVMPSSLADYVEAPTPFLMGLHSGEPVDQRTLDMLVVADLDRGTLHLSKDDTLLQRCLNHPYMQRLERRVRVLMQPSVTEADVVPVSSQSDPDPWVAAARALGPSAPWSPSKQALLLRIFMEFFCEVLRDHHLFLCASSQEVSERASLARRDSRISSAGGSSSGGSSGGAPPGSRVLRGAASLHLQPQIGRSNSLAAGVGLALQHTHNIVGMQALLDHHYSLCRHKDPALVQQVMQGLPFLSFVGEHNSSQQDPTAWLAAGESSLGAWRAAEEELHRTHQKAGPVAASGMACVGQEPLTQVAGSATPASNSSSQSLCWLQGAPEGDSFAGTVVCIPDQPHSALMQPSGLLYKSFPALVLSEYSERSLGGKRRKTAVHRQKRPSVGRRRAISELMGSPLDLRRKTPVGTSTDTSPPRLMRGNALDTGAVAQLQPPLAPGLQLPSLAKISNVSNSSTNASLSEEYSTEAELIGRQIGMLVHLMQVASAAAAAAAAKGAAVACAGSGDGAAGAGAAVCRNGASSGSSSSRAPGDLVRKSSLGGVSAAAVLRRYSSNGARSSRGQLSADVLEAARQLLCIQTGGNGWFIVSRLKELVANPPAPCTDSDCDAAAAHARSPSRGDGKATAGAPAAATAAAGKKGEVPAGSKGSMTNQGKTMLAKSGKILGVNLSGGSSSSKTSGLAGLKVSHGVESFASAASAMASVISRNASSSKQKQANSSSSPTNTGDTSKVSSSAPSSTSGNATPGGGSGGSGSSGPSFQHSFSCRLDDREHHAHKAPTSSDGGATAAGPGSLLTCSTITEGVPTPPTPEPAAPGSSGSSDSETAAAGSEAAAAAGVPTPPGAVGGSSNGSKAAAGQGQQPGYGGQLERPVPHEVFEVLSAMLNSILEVASAQDDSRVVLTVLELASVISCTTGGSKLYLLSTLPGNPSVHTEWFWAFTFAFAVSSSYLNADDFVNVKEVVAKCLQQFAGYLAGVGIPGAAAWVLLMQVATEHLQLAHAGPLEPDLQLLVRHQLAEARQHYCMAPPAGTAGSTGSVAELDLSAAASTSSSQGSKSGSQRRLQQPGQQGAGVPVHVAAALKACGIALPGQQQQESTSTAAADGADSGSIIWQHAASAPSSPIARSKGAVTIPAPAAAAEGADQPTSGGSARVSVSSGAMGSAASDTEAPVTVHRPVSPLHPAAASADRAAGSPSTTPPSSSIHTPIGLSPRGPPSSSSPKLGAAMRAKEGYGSYAKMMSRQQGTNSAGSPGSTLSQVPSMMLDASPSMFGLVGGVLDAEGSEATAVPALSVQGGCLADQGALAWAAVHSKAVVAMAAQSHTAVSAGLDGYLKVLDLSGGTMRLAASMAIPSLQDAAATSAPPAALPVLQLWYDGHRAAVGNSRHQAVWIVDLTGAQASVELSGLGSAVSCLSPLYRNREALLSGLTQASVVCGISSTSSSSSHMAAAYLWDLRRPRRPVSSLNFVPEPQAAYPAGRTVSTADGRDIAAAAACVTRGSSISSSAGVPAGVPGILCLSVHEDGALAAAGFRDGKVLTWDMRQGSTPLSECKGHTGAVRHVSFLPRAASAAAGLGRTPLLLTGSDDWTARVWDAESGSCRGACIGHGGAVTAMQTIHSSAATRFVTGAADGSVGLWCLDGEMVGLVQQHEEPVMLLKQGGDTLVSGAANKRCHVWGLHGLLPNTGSSHGMASTSSQLSTLLGSQRARADVGAMAFDPMAELLCAGHKDGIVSIWNCCYSTQCSTIFE